MWKHYKSLSTRSIEKALVLVLYFSLHSEHCRTWLLQRHVCLRSYRSAHPRRYHTLIMWPGGMRRVLFIVITNIIISRSPPMSCFIGGKILIWTGNYNFSCRPSPGSGWIIAWQATIKMVKSGIYFHKNILVTVENINQVSRWVCGS